ncbi:DUF536 domain-containing protein [Lactiplantibacillus pentosus]|uniref:DUF536 domain-containing protein n=1 Tax=Lactiplantibacillus pentosus TaxID=1589 RepID=UPI001F396F5B|nr:DUF536 domain-containing protein [Lactiplantibacillus pentosus]MCE6032058.1 DUF536 domain-containing protein [Lactiplantibacillus pentosus]
MVKTIKQLADELKVSKQTIQYHYQRLPAKNQQKNSQGINLISPTAERIIRGKVANPLLANKQQTGGKENNELIATLIREVEDLKSQRDKQLATKDQQISSKDRQIEQLTKLIDQQQQLQLAIVAENRQLKERLQKSGGSVEGSESIGKRQVTKTDDVKKETHENITNKKWWHFW